jgi:hypothetical protein
MLQKVGGCFGHADGHGTNLRFIQTRPASQLARQPPRLGNSGAVIDTK